MVKYSFVDADNHYYEPYDCFTRHIEKNYLERAVNIRPGEDGLGRVYIGDRRLGFMSVIQTDYVLPPGALRPLLEGRIDASEIPAEPINARDYPPFMNRDARLALMDYRNIAAAMVFPSLGVCVEHELRDDPEAAFANLRAFNRWLEGEWGYVYRERIFAAPLLSLLDADFAVAELERVLAQGARLVHLKPGPVYGRSPADPIYDGFWARVQEAGVPVVFHLADAGYTELFSTSWGEKPNPPVHRFTLFQRLTCLGERPIVDTLAALVLHNLFGRFPRLRVVSIEQGSEWVPGLLRKMDTAHRRFPDAPGQSGALKEPPSEIFKRHIYVSPLAEEDIVGLVHSIGADHVLFGSDFPHPEGLTDPGIFVERLAGLPEDNIRLIMRENAAGLLGVT